MSRVSMAMPFEKILESYACNPYVVLGLGEECVRVIQECASRDHRIQKLILLSPPLWSGDEALEMRQILSRLVDVGVEIEVYVYGGVDCEKILDFFMPFALVQWWKSATLKSQKP